MNTYCLITARDDKLAGIQPIRGSKVEDVINFTFGVLSERTKSDAALFAALAWRTIKYPSRSHLISVGLSDAGYLC